MLPNSVAQFQMFSCLYSLGPGFIRVLLVHWKIDTRDTRISKNVIELDQVVIAHWLARRLTTGIVYYGHINITKVIFKIRPTEVVMNWVQVNTHAFLNP